MRSNYEADWYDLDWIDPKLNRFMDCVRPEVREVFNILVHKEGFDQAIYIFNQMLAELVFYMGPEQALEFLSEPILNNYWR